MTQKLELVCFRNGTPTSAFFLPMDRPTTIGRAIENAVTLDDERCSRFHATIELRDGKWTLFDLNSRNGTLVDGVRVEGRTEIFVGSRIQIGRETILVEPQREFEAFGDSRETTARLERDDFFSRQNEMTALLGAERAENTRLRSLLGQSSEMIGRSKAIREVEKCIDRAARSKATVLIRGESGVGKELVARAMHERSSRRSGPMVCLNCAAFSESLLTSELFGHEKGAFTGALETKIGKFEAADGGTIFLDEIAEMNPGLQATFLRVLEGAAFERVGGNRSISVDVRVVAATNRNLEEEVASGRFRRDLYFRLRVLEINVPPLREREGDVDLLADHFRERFSQETGRRYLDFSPEARAALNSYHWPGNVRELKNIVERAVLMGNPPTIRKTDLVTSALGNSNEARPESASSESRSVKEERSSARETKPFVPATLKEIERDYIVKTLKHYAWNKSKTAKSLGIERTTLDRKIQLYGLRKE
ncbi:MAG: sigma 54-interacting transcriptional regulator [Thermoguttaceae bacterium]|nr:sigma 54-interacting transcriptional regulator [Thermoguttaceae bacterium]